MSIFDTNASTSFNAFGNSNEAWGSQGGFGMNPAYVSPSYMAPYRPPYTGGHVANPNPGYFQSLYGVSPFNTGGSPYGVNTAQDDARNWDTLHNKGSDFGMAGMQRVAAPLIAFGGAMAFAKAWQVPMPTGPGGSLVQAWNKAWGGATAFRGGRPAATVSGFTNMGARFGGGAAESMLTGMFGRGVMGGAGLGGMAARGAVGLAGGIGAAATGIGIPLALAQGAISAFDNIVSDNYIGMRENASNFRNGFSGISFGGGMGDRYTGRGFSREIAGKMGTDMGKFGARDQVFNSREIASMTSMSAQMGLLDNVSGEQLTTRMKSIVNQVKAVMSVAGTTEFKEAIGIMAKLQGGGVSTANLSSTFSGLGSYASQAGVNVNRMMNTTGAQGQYLFQANGLTPYVGQLTAANAMAGFGSAFRSGLISPDLMARMGGVEGATQSSVTGQLNASQTTYNSIRGFNRYTSGKGDTGGVVSNISRFGEAFAGNPFEASGALILSGRRNISKMMEDEGPLAVYNQAREIANVNPLIGNRAFNTNSLAKTLSGMGMDDSQVQAYVAHLATYQDPKTMQLRAAGTRSNRISSERDYLSQTEQTYGMTIPGVQTAVGAYRGLSAGVTSVMGNFYSGGGGAYDLLSNYFSEVNYGKASGLAGGSAREMAGRGAMPSAEYRTDVAPTTQQALQTESFNRNLSAHRTDIQKVIRAAEEGDTVANRALKGDKDAIQKMADRGVISSKYATADNADKLASTMMSLPKEEGDRLTQRLTSLTGDIEKGVFGGRTSTGKIGGDPSKFDPVEAIRSYKSAWDLQTALLNDKDALENSPELVKKAKGLFGDLSVRDLEKRIRQASGEIADFGIDVSKNYRARKPGESNADYAKDVDLRFDTRTDSKSDLATTDAKIAGVQRRSGINKEEHQRNQARETLMGMGRIDLVAAYDMQSAASELNKAAQMQQQAASLVIDKLGKEVTVGGSVRNFFMGNSIPINPNIKNKEKAQ